MQSQSIPPLSAAIHYSTSAKFWESRAKSLQALVDVQDAEISRLRERLAVHEPPEQAEAETDPAAA